MACYSDSITTEVPMGNQLNNWAKDRLDKEQEINQKLNHLQETVEECQYFTQQTDKLLNANAKAIGRQGEELNTLKAQTAALKTFINALDGVNAELHESHDEDIEKLKATTEHIKRVHNKSLDREDDKHRKIQADIDDAARRVHDEIHALKKTTEQNRELHNNVVTHVTNRFNNLETELICLTDELRHYKASNNKEMRRNRTPIHIAIAVASGALVLHLLHGAWVAWLLTG